MSKNGLTIAEVNAFAERIKAVLLDAETDRRTLEALRALVRGEGNGLARNGSRGPRMGRNMDGKVLEQVKAHKTGAQVGDLMKSLRMNRKAVSRALQRLRDAGSVKMVGTKRLARWIVS